MNNRKFNESDKAKFRSYANSNAPKSNVVKDCILAFVTGGLICTFGQAITELCLKMGVSDEDVKILTPCILIALSSILTASGIYQKLAKHAGAGTLVPITGFSNAITSVSIDSASEGFVLGVGAKMFTIAGPVILYGTAVSVLMGVIYRIFLLF